MDLFVNVNVIVSVLKYTNISVIWTTNIPQIALVSFKINAFLTPTNRHLHLPHYFLQDLSFCYSQLLLPCVVSFLQVIWISFVLLRLYWRIQQDIQPLDLHCLLILLFWLTFFFPVVFGILAILFIMKLLTVDINCTGVLHCWSSGVTVSISLLIVSSWLVCW